MQFWAEVRCRVLAEGMSRRQACREFNINWRTLDKILAHEEPPGYRQQQPRKKPKIGPFLPIIEEVLQADRTAPKKQRHTAKRIWERLRAEHGFDGGYTIVKDAVRSWKLSHKEAFLPLSHPPGEAQVDFGYADIWLNGVQTKVALFVMTLPYCGAIFCQAFPRECTESFLEGHRRAFEFFGGVPHRISYDNSAIAAAKILGKRERKLTREFLRLKSHYLFQEHFCLVRRANEKGHVERLLGVARKSYLVPLPRVASLEELNETLVTDCRENLSQRTRGKPATKGELLAEDQAKFLPLPKQAFEARRVEQAHADSLSLVRFDKNSYSVPTKHAHRTVTVVATLAEVRIIFGHQLIARHQRCWEREQTFYEPVHYLALLERKPGGFDHAKPLEQWELPACFGILRRRLEARWDGTSRTGGTREFIRVLRLLERFSLSQLTSAVEYALDIDVLDADSVRMVLEHRAERPVELFSLDGRPHLSLVRVPATDVAIYGTLLEDPR